MDYFFYIFMVFVVYSFAGYVCEMIFCAIIDKKVVNKGFLCGPILPIYGVGSVFMLYLLTRYKSDPLVVFVFGAIICSALEYFTSFIFEKLFHNRWWDYSNYKYHLNGRICLLNSILFGAGGLFIIYLAQPTVKSLFSLVSTSTLNIIAIICMIILIADIIYSVIVAYNLRNRLIIVEELKSEKLAKIPEMFNSMLKKRVSNFRIYPSRLLKAFPKLKKDHVKEFKVMKKVDVKDKKTKRNK